MDIDPAHDSGGAFRDDMMPALLAPALDPLFQRQQRTGVASAWHGHVAFAHWVVAACRPRLLIELGTHNGVSYSAFCEALARYGGDARAFAVDTWQGDEHAGRFGDDVYQDLRRFHDERYSGFSELLRCTFEEALPYFADGTVDLLHVDGLHTYEAVRADWESWRPKLSDRAVVLFHDTNVRERAFGVWSLWSELSRRHPSFEFLHGHGLGVLAYGAHAPSAIARLCALRAPREIATVRERFALIGERWVEGAEGRANLLARQRAEGSLAGASAELVVARRDLDAARETAARAAEQERERLMWLETERSRARAEQTMLREQMATLEHETERLQEQAASAAGLRADLARSTAEAEAMRAAIARDQAQIVALRRDRDAVVSSLAWRLTAPLRRISTRFPATIRQSRRAAGFAVALLSGRLPQRLRLRRRVREDARTLALTSLFDRERYLARYPDIARSGTDPLWHYIWTGAAAGFDPHPLFDSRWYLDEHPELAARGVNPLAHYVREGAALGWDPHPLFDTAYYVAQEPEARGNALPHFLTSGAARGVNPNPLFDMDGYWEEYLRGRDLSDDPLSHYVLRGAAAGCDPHALFDTDWYALTHPDSAGWNPLAHYLRVGRAKGHAPCLLTSLAAEPTPALRFTTQADPDVSIIVPTYGRLFDTLRCLTSIMAHSGSEVDYEVIVVDDRPDAPIAPRLRAIPGLRVEQHRENLGFLRSCNHAAGLAAGRHVVLLNNDTQVHPGWLAPLVRLADADPRVGIVGCKLLNADGTVQEAGGILHRNGWGYPYGRGDRADRPDYNFVREVDVVIGACFLVRHAAWEAVGGFDERYAPAYYEEFDLAFALRDRGWKVLYQPASRVTHFDSSSYGAAERDRQSAVNHARFCRKWAGALAGQPPADSPLLLARERPVIGGRILMVDDLVPEPDKHAGGLTVFSWLRLLRQSGLGVIYAPALGGRPEPYTSTLEQMGIEVLYDTDIAAWLEENGRHLDWVWVARPDIAEPLLDVIARCVPGGRAIYYTHDLHFLREQRRFELDGDPASLEASRRYRRAERDIFRRAARVVTPSSDEVAAIRELAPHADVRVVPAYPVAAEPLGRAGASGLEARDTLLFVGGYAHLPNVDAALWLAREIMPLVWRAVPEARLVLAGSKPPPEIRDLASSRVEVPGWVADLGPLYARARLSINALRYGAGVKGKIVASLQAGLPVVTTPIGNEGLDLADGVEALVATSAEAVAAAAVRLLRDPTLCARLAAAGRTVIRRRFDEDMARRTLLAVLDRDICPVCRHHTRGAEAPMRCEVCAASITDRQLASAILRPWRHLCVTSLPELPPLLAGSRVEMPDGPLSAALGHAGVDASAGDMDLLVWDQPGGETAVSRLRPGGRMIYPATAAPGGEHTDMIGPGYEFRLHEDCGVVVVEATRVAPHHGAGS